MESHSFVGVTKDQLQRQRLKLPKGDVKFPDGRVLRRLLGYDLSKLKMNDVTRNSFLESGGWLHAPTDLIISAGIEDTEHWGPLLHTSMSYRDHDPSWEEIKAMRDAFFPKNIDVMMMLPRAGFYVNVHPHCFHLWQCPQEWGIG